MSWSLQHKKKKSISCFFFSYIFPLFFFLLGKQRRLKQAKEEAQDEIERYRQERDRQFKEFEAKVSIILYSEKSIKLQFLIYIHISVHFTQ